MRVGVNIAWTPQGFKGWFVVSCPPPHPKQFKGPKGFKGVGVKECTRRSP